MIQTTNLKSKLLLGAGSVAALGVVAPAYAQQDVETVVVTGSRIPNRDFSSDSPLSTVSGDSLKQTGALEITDVLATMPQVVPGFAAGSNNPPSNGQQAVDLRGLGANRAVVLIDGRRVAPSNDDGTVDLQTIPQSLIDRVEIITGGASAVYGPDAITGVVNFVMKQNFEGVAVDAQYGVSDRGDDNEFEGSITVGGNFDGGKGNMVFDYDYGYRRELFDSARGFASQATTGTSRSPTGSYITSTGNLPSQAAVNGYFTANGGAPAGQVLNSSSFGFNDNGSLFNFGGASGGNKVYNYKSDPSFPATLFCANPSDPNNCKSYSYNFQPPNLLIVPLKRQNFMTIGHYDIDSDITAYVSAKFTNYNSASSLAPSPAPTQGVTSPDGGSVGPTGYIVPANNPYIPSALTTLLASRIGDACDKNNQGKTPPGATSTCPTSASITNVIPGTGANEDFLVATRFSALGPRLDEFNNSVFQETAGLKGNLPYTNLKFDTFVSYGQLDTIETQFGNVSNSAVENLLFGNGSGDCSGYGGLNLFGATNAAASTAALQCVQRVTKNSTHSTFTDIEGNVTGQLWDLPGGTMAFSLGADYREQTYTFLADPLLGAGDVSGFPPESDEAGSTKDKEVFGELYIPLVKDLPWAETASITLGGRYTNQEHTTGGVAWTEKVEGDWGIMHGLTARASFEVATRMPNISELTGASVSSAPAAADPCNFDSPFRTGAHAAQVTNLCSAMGASPVGTFQQANGQVTILSSGNSALKPETADTFTVGLSYQSSFSDPWISGLAGTIDYWNIDLHSPIGVDSFDILYGCYNYDGSNPNYDPNNANCKKIVRSGQSMYIFGNQANLAKYKLDGVDFALNWSLDLHDTVEADPMWGTLSFALAGTYLADFDVQGSAAGKEINYAGTIGATSPIGLSTDGSYPHWKGTLTTTWAFGDASVSARINYIDGMKSSLDKVGWTGLNFGVGTVQGTSTTFYLDLLGSYAVTPWLNLRGGILNVVDLQPRYYNPSQQDGTDPATYDIVGRRYFVGLGFKF